MVKTNDMNRLISDNIERIKSLCMTHNVESLFAFGSVCTDKFNDKSDIDLLISFKPLGTDVWMVFLRINLYF